MHAASRQGTPSLTSLSKDDEVSCEVRPPRSPIRSLTLHNIREVLMPKLWKASKIFFVIIRMAREET